MNILPRRSPAGRVPWKLRPWRVFLLAGCLLCAACAPKTPAPDLPEADLQERMAATWRAFRAKGEHARAPAFSATAAMSFQPGSIPPFGSNFFLESCTRRSVLVKVPSDSM